MRPVDECLRTVPATFPKARTFRLNDFLDFKNRVKGKAVCRLHFLQAVQQSLLVIMNLPVCRLLRRRLNLMFVQAVLCGDDVFNGGAVLRLAQG